MSKPTTRQNRSSAIADNDWRLKSSHQYLDDLWDNSLLSDPTPDARDELGRSIRYAARLASLLAVTPHHPTLLELLRDVTLDIEHLWLVADESDDQEVQL